MTHPTPIIEAFRDLLGVDTPNIDNLIARLSRGNVKGKEGPLLEFKASYVPMPEDKDTPDACRWNVIEAIVGMANSQGGCVVLGLAENKGTKELERGSGDPDNVLGKCGREDKDLADHTRKALFKGGTFKISDDKIIKVGQDFWEQLESQTNGIKGFVTCRSHVGGDTNGFPVVAIFVEPIPVDTPIIQVEIINKSETSSEEHLIGYYHRSESTAETFFSVREKWEEKWQTIPKSGDRVKDRHKDSENNKREREYLSFVRQRDPQRTLKALSEKINNLESTSEKPVFSSVNPPQTANFVGRDKELEKLHGLLSEGKIPVITGPGGTGKSELVFQYAAQHKADYPGGLFQIDMETVKSWDEAFRRLLGTTRVDMRNLLGFPKPTIANADGNEKREPTKEEIAGALVRRAKSVGRILLVLDNIESVREFLYRSGFEKLSLPKEVCLVVTARSADVKFRPTDRAVKRPLSDLSLEAARDLLLTDHPAQSEEEQIAVDRIARLLDCRVLYLRSVPALLDDPYSPLMGSYKLLEKALRNSLLETVDAAVADYGEEGRTPSALWSLTRANLSRYPLGKAWEKLAHIASFFSADGFHKHILRHLWDALIAPGIAWEADNGQAFDQALDVLKRHGLLSNSNLELRMHRLTAEALHRSALEDDSTLEEKIGKFFAETLDAEDWFELLGKHPQFAEYCPGAMLEYSPSNWSVKVYWPMLLEKQPQLAKLCLEHNPNAMGWALVLGYLPEITDDCPWEKFGGRDWARLLARQPQFKDRCKWEKLDGHDWCILLGKQPQFADTSLGVPWEELDGFDWAQLLMSQPQLACHCLWWGKLDDSDWDNLLLAQPQFATYRDSRT